MRECNWDRQGSAEACYRVQLPRAPLRALHCCMQRPLLRAGGGTSPGICLDTAWIAAGLRSPIVAPPSSWAACLPQTSHATPTRRRPRTNPHAPDTPPPLEKPITAAPAP
jgi:hypothetical protein